MNLRTVTLGFDPDGGPRGEIERTVSTFMALALERAEQAGLPLRTRRLLLPPVNAAARFSRANARALVEWVAGLADDTGVRWFNVPFTAFADVRLEHVTEAALEVVGRHPMGFVNYIVAHDGRIHREGVLEAARLVQAVSRRSQNGYDNFRVGASANCPAGAPFFPFTHHEGEPGFSVSLESPPLFRDVIGDSRGEDLAVVRDRLVDRLAGVLRDVDALGRSLEQDGGVRYLGVDASLAPFPDETGSVAALIEALGADDFGASGTLFITSVLTDVLRTAVAQSGVRSVGFCGVMDSLLEDPAIARNSTRKTFTIDSLLAFAAVCGCGLDMVPIPGDTPLEEIASLILDVAALSTALGKPLGARLLPIPGKHANEFTDFSHDFFFNCRVMSVRNRACPPETFAGVPIVPRTPRE